ncbi:Zn-dependent hydrolase [Siminovitchia acidinfaciens]|uniref:Zn-dependent hydrolase n=1 Tax=Siminovitchia acidinfaciens TaxID=2321395 RepID=A0A429Y031_9BACI|nr:Zn-dependent hydrolase [Siminovitchia acidinfaciens]
MAKNKIDINMSRLKAAFEVSSKIGATEKNGLTRLTLTEEDRKIRDIFVQWLKEEGLSVRIDDVGNIYGKREGRNKNAKSIMIGSHLDTQPRGGRFDGVLGVLSSLEVIRTLNENNIVTERPIEIVNFTNEEGERFTPPMIGSGVATGNYTKEFAYGLRDKNGVSFEEALNEIGYNGQEENRLSNVEYFVELHIEQGPLLEKNRKEIGIVKGVKGMTRFEVTVTGHASHGAHPAYGRKDALVAASKMVLAIDEVTKSYEDLSTTVGVFEVFPSVVNIFAGEVRFTFDVRHLDDQIRNRVISNIKENLKRISEESEVVCSIKQTWNIDGTHFSTELTGLILEETNKLNYSHQYIVSGAGHDAKFMNDICKTAMIFTPSANGFSHCEEEYTSYEDIQKATTLLLNVVMELANKV